MMNNMEAINKHTLMRVLHSWFLDVCGFLCFGVTGVLVPLFFLSLPAKTLKDLRVTEK